MKSNHPMIVPMQRPTSASAICIDIFEGCANVTASVPPTAPRSRQAWRVISCKAIHLRRSCAWGAFSA